MQRSVYTSFSSQQQIMHNSNVFREQNNTKIAHHHALDLR